MQIPICRHLVDKTEIVCFFLSIYCLSTMGVSSNPVSCFLESCKFKGLQLFCVHLSSEESYAIKKKHFVLLFQTSEMLSYIFLFSIIKNLHQGKPLSRCQKSCFYSIPAFKSFQNTFRISSVLTNFQQSSH